MSEKALLIKSAILLPNKFFHFWKINFGLSGYYPSNLIHFSSQQCKPTLPFLCSFLPNSTEKKKEMKTLYKVLYLLFKISMIEMKVQLFKVMAFCIRTECLRQASSSQRGRNRDPEGSAVCQVMQLREEGRLSAPSQCPLHSAIFAQYFLTDIS